MDKLSFMKAYCRVIELGSFSKAAEDLAVSPALLSRDMKLLEESLGCVLLSRTTRTMSVTDHGQLYYDESKRVLEAIGQIEEKVREGAGAIKGCLRINAPLSFGIIALSPMLPEFMEQFPDLEVRLVLDDHVLDMVQGGFDLSIRVRAEMPDSNLIAQKIAPVQQRLFASEDYLERLGIPMSPTDLVEHQHVSFLLADHADSWPLIGPDGETEVVLSPQLSLGSSIVLRDMLIAGQGIGALPSFISDPFEATGELRRVLPNHELARRYVYAVTPSRLGVDAKTVAFLDHLKKSLAGGI